MRDLLDAQSVTPTPASSDEEHTKLEMIGVTEIRGIHPTVRTPFV